MSKEVREFWERQVVSYTGNYADKPTGTNYNFRTRLALASTLAKGYGGRLLDCATGSGEITEAILAGGDFAAADLVDISSPMLEISRQRMARLEAGVQIRWICSDVFSFLDSELPAPRYNLVLCLGLIAHTGKLDVLLKLCRERLARGGAILLQTSLLDHPGTRFLRWFSARRHERKKGYGIHYYAEADVRRTAEEAGLTMLAQRRFVVGVPYGDRVCPRMNYWLEKWGESWAARHGMDGLYLLGRS
jgi:2-polyprenyl-3-methyl-5-hydroxy-6-metoxy-1,4-benzoquinol methylase